MRFSSSEYTKMRFWPLGSLQRSTDPLAAGGGGLAAPTQKPWPYPTPALGPAGLEFSALASKKLCIPDLVFFLHIMWM